LQGEPKAAAIPPLTGDVFYVVVIEMEVSRQFVGRQRVGITAITLPLRGGQKIDGHRASPITITRNATVRRFEKTKVLLNSSRRRRTHGTKALQPYKILER